MDAVTSAIYTRIKELIGADTLVYADQNAPRPALPYWTMRLQTQRKLGRDQLGQGVDANGNQKVSGVREGTVQIQCIGAGAASKCADLRDNLSKTTVIEKWSLAKIPVFNIGDVLNVPYQLDGAQLEPRASLDIFIRFGTSLLDNVGAIDTVDVNAQFDSKPDLAETITIVL